MTVCRYFQAGYCRYGQNCQFEHIYGSKYSYHAPQNTGERSRNMYNNKPTNNVTNPTNSSAASIFRSAAQTQTQSHSIFGSRPQNNSSVFDRPGTQQNVFSTNNQAKSLFAQATQQFSTKTNDNFNQRVDPKSIFAQASHNVFGHNSSTPQNFFTSPPQQFQNAANVFANTASTFFGQEAKTVPNPTGNIFQISDKPLNQSFNNSFDQVCEDEGVYSKIENLTEYQLQSFQSEIFKLGCIPDVPPPKILCV